MKIKRALVIEEDEELRGLLASEALEEGFSVHTAHSLKSAKEVFLSLDGQVDLLLCDFRIPETSLEELLPALRELARTPFRVLAITDSMGDPNPARMESLGVDGTIRKPVERLKLRERIRSLVGDGPSRQGQIRSGGVFLDSRSFDVLVEGDRVHLTPNEFKLLEALMEARGAVLAREELILRVQGRGVAVVDRAIDTHVFSLRKKLGPAGFCIETVRGEGYRFRGGSGS
jgi:two-component system phosphate regulon response regulator PhoB